VTIEIPWLAHQQKGYGLLYDFKFKYTLRLSLLSKVKQSKSELYLNQ